jgi:hypothetical protein
MFIKLTNASLPYQDKVFIIKKKNIISIFETIFEDETVTTVFCGASGVWNVRETVDEVYSLL